MDVSKFETSDINLASFLSANGITYVIIPVTPRQAKFVFNEVPQSLLQAWLSGEPQANATKVINAYRHLVRDSRIGYYQSQEVQK